MEDPLSRREHPPFQAHLKAIDEDTGRPEARLLYNRRRSELDQGPERHPLEVEAGSGDILAELTRCNLEASFRKGCKELGRDQVDLPKIGQAGLAASEITVPDKRTCVCVAFDAMAFHSIIRSRGGLLK